MFNTMTLATVGGGVATAEMVTITVGAWAPATAAGGFGDHVSTCAQTIAFTVDHNPACIRGSTGGTQPTPSDVGGDEGTSRSDPGLTSAR